MGFAWSVDKYYLHSNAHKRNEGEALTHTHIYQITQRHTNINPRTDILRVARAHAQTHNITHTLAHKRRSQLNTRMQYIYTQTCTHTQSFTHVSYKSVYLSNTIFTHAYKCTHSRTHVQKHRHEWYNTCTHRPLDIDVRS